MGDVLTHSGAPRGSAYHYFPGGRDQLLCEAVDYAAEYVASTIAAAASGVQMLDTAVRFYRDGLTDSDFRAGCPVLAVAVEAGDPDTGADVVARTEASELATLVIAGLEGALAIARAERDLAPMDAVHRQLRRLLQAATERKGS